MAGNFASQSSPVARIDRVAAVSGAGQAVVKIPGLDSSTVVSMRLERPAAVSTAIPSEVEGGTAGQRKSIRLDEAYRTGE